MISTQTIAWIGGSIVVFFSFSFLYVVQIKIQGWNRDKVSPLPLEGFLSISSYLSIFIGLTIMFTGVLETFTFSPLNSFIASFLLAITTAFPMWGMVKSLLAQVESETIKPLEPGQF